MSLKQYQVQNAVRLVDGYFLPFGVEAMQCDVGNDQVRRNVFIRAQQETIQNLEDQLRCVRELEFLDFQKHTTAMRR